jgi:hypothetical protein
MTEKNKFEPDEVASLSFKAKWLEEELSILGQGIGSRSQVLQTYVAFLKSSEEVQYDGLTHFHMVAFAHLPAFSGDMSSAQVESSIFSV